MGEELQVALISGPAYDPLYACLPAFTEATGVKVSRYQIMFYVFLGALAGVAGAIESARLVTGQPTAGEGYELRVIAAVVIGGGSLSG